jgi:hypothetical protein
MGEIQKNLTPNEIENIKRSLLNIWDEVLGKVSDMSFLWAKIAGGHSLPINVSVDRNRVRNIDKDRTFDRAIDERSWNYFFGSGRLMDIMSQDDIERFHKKLSDPDPFTAEEAFKYYNSAEDIAVNSFERLLHSVFEKLTSATYRPGNSWKNDRKKQNNREIDNYFRMSSSIKKGHFGKWEWHYYSVPIYDDLEKVCFLLDGKNPPKQPNTINCRIKSESCNIIGNEYFTITLYLNGNNKVNFLRDDIREKLNKYGPKGNALGVDIKTQIMTERNWTNGE